MVQVFSDMDASRDQLGDEVAMLVDDRQYLRGWEAFLQGGAAWHRFLYGDNFNSL